MSKECEVYTSKMLKTIEVLKSDFATVRAGRANPRVLDKITVEHYGSTMYINQLAGDAAIYDPGSATLREKKVSDLHNRVALVNELPGAVLLSIHQNSLPSSPSTRGAQVFWNRQEGAEELASSIQESLNGAVNAGHEKKAAQVPSSVYLMKEITAPGVLVECGFLSNAAETEQLKDPAYQTKLAAAIAAGVLNSDKR